MTYLIQCQHGLGDNIYARPFIRAAALERDVALVTPWPELFSDLPVTFAHVDSTLRTQAKNIARQDADLWTSPENITDSIRLGYGHAELAGGSTICEAIERRLPLCGRQFVFDLPPMGSHRVETEHPIAFVRPVTVRSEWSNPARNPLPEYIAECASQLMETHTVVCVADLEPGREWLVGDLPPHHACYLRGQLPAREMLALFAASDVVVGGVGWIVPAAVAFQRPAFIVCGGQGMHNSPSILIDPRMAASRVSFALPENYCRCANMKHDCPKTIPQLSQRFRTFCERLLWAS